MLTLAGTVAILRAWGNRVNVQRKVRAGGQAATAGVLDAPDVHAAPRPAAFRCAASLSRRARVLLWDFERGSLAYDLLCLFLLLLLLLVPAAWWGDPMAPRP
jgi:hypothetical protein